jgi:hypothetical protein
MRQIVAFFKAVAPQQMADPGEQLRKVLDFRGKIEAEKKHFFTTFDEVSVFQKHLRRHLASWLQRHEAEKGKETV